MQSPNELVKEVAELLEQGKICYVDIGHREVTAFDLTEENSAEDQEMILMMENKPDKYFVVKPMSNEVLIQVMKDFLQEVTDSELMKELQSSLTRKKPTRNFLNIVDSRLDILQHWTLFRAEQNIDYVGQQFIREYNY